MNCSRLATILLLLALAAPAIHSQNQEGVLDWPPVPAGPNEPVGLPAHALLTPAERTPALELLDRARQNLFLFVPRATPFELKASFTASGSQYDGAGTLDELWIAPNLWRFSARLNDFSMTRITSRGPTVGEQSGDVIPMRLQSAWHLLTAPINPAVGANWMLRSADVNWRGMQLTCILASGDVPKDGPRHWVEMEFCVDAKTGLLTLYSMAPGNYVLYEYSGALQFDGHVIPRQITEFLGETPVLRIHVDGITDASEVNHASLEPPPGMQRMEALLPATRLPMLVNGPRVPGVPMNCVLVHATIGSSGTINEEEMVTSSAPELSQRAFDLIKNSKQPRMPKGAQREVFINVEFMGAKQNE